MLGTFLGLETSLRGLEAARAGINTVSHNIDNTNTPGYSRERLQLTEAQALDVPGFTTTGVGQVGQGVDVEQVQRVRSSFLDEQYRQQNAALGEANVEQDTLNKVAGIINEPSNTGISHAMQQYWQAWDTLGSNPGELSAKTSVIDAGQTLTDVMNQTANQLSDLHTNINHSVSAVVDQVNSIVGQIANVSNQIAREQQTGTTPNNLLDQRGELLDKLSQLTNFTTKSTSVKSDGGISYDEFSLFITSTDASTGDSTEVTMIDGTQPMPKDSVDQSGTSVDWTEPLAGQRQLLPPNMVGQLQTNAEGQMEVGPIDTSGSTPGPVPLQGAGGEIQGYQSALKDVQNYQDDLNNFAANLANGQTSVTLLGDWDVPSPLPSALNNVQVPDPSGNLVDLSTLQPPPTVIKAGTTIKVYGINQLTQMGYAQDGQGQAFFTTSDGSSNITASNIRVGVTESSLAAAAKYDQNSPSLTALTGDGSLATLISSLKNASMQFTNPSPSAGPTATTTTGTLDNYLTSVVGQLGLQGQEANNNVNTQQGLVQQLDNQRQSISGVSIDEEMTKMIRYQQAYNASAKMVSAVNGMLNALMSNV